VDPQVVVVQVAVIAVALQLLRTWITETNIRINALAVQIIVPEENAVSLVTAYLKWIVVAVGVKTLQCINIQKEPQMAEKTGDKTAADEVTSEIERLLKQADQAALVRLVEISDIGKDAGDKTLHIIGLMNAAAVACKLGNYDLCFGIVNHANAVDEAICTDYLHGQAHMYEMMKTLSGAGAFNN